MKTNSRRIFTAAVAVISAIWLALVISAEEPVKGSTVTSVIVNGGRLSVEARITSYYADQDAELALFSVHSDDLSELWFPLVSVPASSKVTFTADIETIDPAVWQTGFVIGIKDGIRYQAITDIAYIDNIAENSVYHNDRKEPEGIKGLQVQLITDAIRLGVRSSTVTIVVNELLGTDGETFNYGGKTYTLDAGKLSRIDEIMSSLCSAGIKAYAELLWRDSETGLITIPTEAINDFSGTWSALTWFIADRYCSPDRYCDSYIIGYELNDKRARVGDVLISETDYLSLCANMIRRALTSVTSVSEGNSVFISVSDLWSAEWNPYGAHGAETLIRYISGHIPMSGLGISVNVFPGQTNGEDNGLHIGPGDLETVTSSGAALYIIGYAGFSGAPGTASETEQAREYLKLYDAVCLNGRIESFIWHRHVDFDREDGYYGLYSSSKDLIPSQTKEIYKAFLFADRRDSEAVSYRLSLSGQTDLPSQATRECYYVSQSDVDTTRSVMGFSSDSHGFLPSFNSTELGISDEKGVRFMRVLASRSESTEWFGCSGTLPFFAVKGAECLSFRMKVEGSGDKELCVILRSGNKYLEFSAYASDGWNDYSFPVKSFCGDTADGSFNVIVLARNGNGNNGLSLDIEKICVSSSSYSYLIVPVIAILSAAVLTMTVALIVYYSHKRRRNSYRGFR